MLDLQAIFRPYNPWWAEPHASFENIPAFHRPIFYQLCEELRSVPQILSITGPRRIGKSTLLYQLIQNLLADTKCPFGKAYPPVASSTIRLTIRLSLPRGSKSMSLLTKQ